MRLITGDECGLIKECIPELSVSKRKEGNNQNWGAHDLEVTKDKGFLRVHDEGVRQARQNSVVDLAWVNSKQDTSFASLRIDGVVQIWLRSSLEDKEYARYRSRPFGMTTNIFAASPTPQGAQQQRESKSNNPEPTIICPWTKPLGLFSCQDTSERDAGSRLCACNALGDVVVLKSDAVEKDDDTSAVLSRFSVVSSKDDKNKFGNAHITATGFDCKRKRVALGGQERETTLWDLESSKQVWKAKNLSADPQTLLPPQVWPSSIAFLEHADTSVGSNIMGVGSAHCEVRIYDVRDDSVQRRPISFTPNGLIEHRVTTLCLVDPFHLVVGDSSGDLHTLDLRTLGKKKKDTKVATMGRYVGPAGSVRGLVKHQSLSKLAAVGLDRMLRLYDTKTRKQLYCLYLRQRLNCVLFGEEDSWLSSDRDGRGDLSGDVDQDDKVVDYINSDDDDRSIDHGESPTNERREESILGDVDDDEVLDSSDGDDDDDDDDDGSSSQESEEGGEDYDNLAATSRKKRKID